MIDAIPAADHLGRAAEEALRRATNTVNYSGELPLAQGVTFTV